MRNYSNFMFIGTIGLRVITAYWFFLYGSRYTNLKAWNIQFAVIIFLSILNFYSLYKSKKKISIVFFLILDFFLIELALYPIRENQLLTIILLFTHYWLMIYFLEFQFSIPFFVISMLFVQFYSGETLVSGILIRGLSWGGRIEILASQLIAIAILFYLDAIGKISDKSQEQRLLYEQNLSNLLETNLDLQNYAMKERTIVREEERKRIAGELHDTLMHSLLNLKMAVESMRDHLAESDKSLIKLLDLSESILNNLWTNIESEIYEIRNRRDSEKEGLNRIHDLVKTFQDATQIDVQSEYTNFPISIGQKLDRIVYRVIQEGLTNAFRHGKADKIMVMLWQERDCYKLVVRDNGIGGKMDAANGIGLWGIKHRLAAIGGSVSFNPNRNGFEIQAEIPKKRDKQ